MCACDRCHEIYKYIFFCLFLLIKFDNTIYQSIFTFITNKSLILFSIGKKMTDSIKLSEIHRANIEYERQRHLANWFIKSSPHMAKPVPVQSPTKAQQKLATKNGSGGIIQQQSQQSQSQNPLFFLGKVNHVPSGINLPLSPAPVFNSQTNLPIQIQSTPIAHKPKLRRFTSQYSNMFSVDDFENARLARRNELELKQRQLNRYKMNSLSSGGDCSTGDSKGSKFSNEVSHFIHSNIFCGFFFYFFQ